MYMYAMYMYYLTQQTLPVMACLLVILSLWIGTALGEGAVASCQLHRQFPAQNSAQSRSSKTVK